ncbi:MAG: hypothetical protein IJ583_03505 [Firmicutes bacterium]|nr:hypothetical protein [Bacillota bacterium]
MATYVPNEKVRKCIEEKDLTSLREYIGTIIYTDRAFLHGEFEAAIKYITEDCYLVELFEPFNGYPPLKSKITNIAFSKTDFTEAVYELKNNFCRERIEDIKMIGRIVYGEIQREAEQEEKNKNDTRSPIMKFKDKLLGKQ